MKKLFLFGLVFPIFVILGLIANPTKAFATNCPVSANPFPIVAGQKVTLTFPHIGSVVGDSNTTLLVQFSKNSDKVHGEIYLKSNSDSPTLTLNNGFPTSDFYDFYLAEKYSPNAPLCNGSIYVTAGTCGLQADGQTIDDSQTHCATNYHPVAYPSDGMGSVAACVCQADTSNNGTSGVGFGKLGLCKGTNIKGVDTPLGCIQSDPGTLVNTLLKIAFGVAGGIAILLIIIGGFKVATSQGDPDALEDGRNMITAAVIGLVFILLASVILGIIGVDILGISFFQKSGNGVTIKP